MKPMLMQTRSALVLVRQLLLCATFVFGGAAQAEPEEPPPQQTILDSLPPLPPPTEEQLQRGREMLDKIVYVVENVPLTDAAAVMKVFGFTDLMTYESSMYTRLVPKAKTGGQAVPADLVGTGFTDIEAAPVFLASKNNRVAARLSGSFAIADTCVSIEDVRKRIASRAVQISSSRITDIHPVLRPKAANDVGLLGFRLVSNPFATKTSITFRFVYQRCAQAFTFAYFNIEGVQQ